MEFSSPVPELYDTAEISAGDLQDRTKDPQYGYMYTISMNCSVIILYSGHGRASTCVENMLRSRRKP